ncbi:MAG: 6-carboxytetrahydropterin synthase [Sedimenticola sp.]|nr:6-carboxytetrahydropterin synthase [Sedimenticola sp.]
MHCLECGESVSQLDNEHLLVCSSLTLQEYAIRHHLPLDMLLHGDQINQPDQVKNYARSTSRPTEAARQALLGLRWAGLLQENAGFVEVPGEIRRLDLLLWTLDRLADYGFQFRQLYEYRSDTHRVVARNLLRAPLRNLVHVGALPEPPPSFLDALAVYIAFRAEWHADYLFMEFNQASYAHEVREYLACHHQIRCRVLDVSNSDDSLILRTLTHTDGEKLLQILRARLMNMPTAWERFQATGPAAKVTKELVFDSAHFITDHPAKCSNLHGGRYVLQVEVTGRIDPLTGCVVDYGYLKRVVNRQVIDRFDHHHLNYTAEALAWRSSTEMLCVYIWERLIDYLPGLSGLRLYETTHSWCDYQGRSLSELQVQGAESVLYPFRSTSQVTDLRQRLIQPADKSRMKACSVS